MSKKYVIILIVVVLLFGLVALNRSNKASIQNLESLLGKIDDFSEQVNQAIDDLDNIDPEEDIDAIINGKISATDFDSLLDALANAEDAFNSAIDDLDNIDDEDNLDL